MDPSVENYLQSSRIPLRLSAVNESGWPIVLSLWYLYEEGQIYCATPQTAQIVSYLQREPRCGFEVAGDDPPYCGVRGRARATIDPQRGLEILRRLLVRYLGDTHNPLAQKLLNRDLPEVALCLEPQAISTWNFENRMADSLEKKVRKICP